MIRMSKQVRAVSYCDGQSRWRRRQKRVEHGSDVNSQYLERDSVLLLYIYASTSAGRSVSSRPQIIVSRESNNRNHARTNRYNPSKLHLHPSTDLLL